MLTTLAEPRNVAFGRIAYILKLAFLPNKWHYQWCICLCQKAPNLRRISTQPLVVVIRKVKKFNASTE